MLGPQAKFAQYGESGAWISENLPHFSTIADEVSFLKAVTTDQFNHAPAQLLVHTGSPRLGRPSLGSWVTYGLGTENQNLPGFVVLTSGGKNPDAGKRACNAGVKVIPFYLSMIQKVWIATCAKHLLMPSTR
jgi:hypothetical protein